MQESVINAILHHLPIGLMIISSEGVIVDANPAACSILGCSEVPKGKKWSDAFESQKENMEFNRIVVRAILKEQPRIEGTTRFRTADGVDKYLSVISSALRDENHDILSLVVLFEDLTEMQKAHEREKRYMEHNRVLATERAEALRTFAKSVAHQIRNPLMSMAGMANIIKRKAPEEVQEYANIITDEAFKLERLVQTVTQFSSITVNRFEPTPLSGPIHDAVRHAKAHFAERGVRIDWMISLPENLMINADRGLLADAFYEVLLNAVEFGGTPPSLIITVTEGEMITITITDNGKGFSDMDLTMAFDPFYTTKSDGVGMGLSKARRIVNEHQGQVKIHNGEDGGVVDLYLPPLPLSEAMDEAAGGKDPMLEDDPA